jgi:hypothetical protein
MYKRNTARLYKEIRGDARELKIDIEGNNER